MDSGVSGLLDQVCDLTSLNLAHHLLDILLFIGAPALCKVTMAVSSQTGDPRTQIVWPALIMVHGKPRHPQSEGSVGRANGDIKDMLIAWIGDTSTADWWSTGIKFVQFQKNSSLHSGIKRAPYAVMFGCDVKVGLTSSFLPTGVIECMQNEDDLLLALDTPHTETQQPSPSSTVADPNLPNTSQSNLIDIEDLGLVNTSPNSPISTDDLLVATVNENISAIDTIMSVLTADPTFTNNLLKS
ncbi:KRAB-A domain-containing protein 2-like [Oopsacas minuta]|uniref:KRAB-A domain-containing protein 2-like n=1 Tax=Oopsacas minuta TaxID=111878 RepID=A0AAV7JF52_9METZ|nr:KRAB-A domain-containing protein 2-like [Oopsacas minuta]